VTIVPLKTLVLEVFGMTMFSQEQQAAINSTGGLLVSAGAGSGKTAVLIEHLIFWIEKNVAKSSISEWEISLQLKKLVVITFTVKASEEMKMRLFERLEEMIYSLKDHEPDGPELHFWLKIKRNLHAIYIGTIDGLFVRVIKNNTDLLPLSVSFEIVSDQLWNNKLKKLYNSWLNTLGQEDKKFAKRWSKKLLAWIKEIFQNTENRIYWSSVCKNEFSVSDFLKTNEEVCTNDFLGITWKESFITLDELIKSLDSEKYQDKKWFQFAKETQKCHQSNILDHFHSIQNVLKQFKGLRAPTSEELSEIALCIKQIRQIVNDYEEVISEWKECVLTDGAKDWKNSILLAQKLMQYMLDHYGDYSGFCFSDLSYYANQILTNSNAQLGIPNYVVVDELQDTSMLQLQQIFALTGRDSRFLYGVGDVKQAIYGFRGGESQVFFEFEKIVNHKKIDLIDNYRSVKEIVDFNNKLFSKLFSKTKSLDQVAKAQFENKHNAVVKVFQWELSTEDKIPEWQQEILEFYGLIEQIKQLVQQDKSSSMAVLFRTNEQIKKFASLLYQEGLSFTVQWKIAYSEDPLFLIFQTLMYIGHAKNRGLKTDSLENILKFHFASIEFNGDTSLQEFYNNWSLFDPFTAYFKYLGDLKVAIAYQAPFLSLLKLKSSQDGPSFEDYLVWLEEIKDDENLVGWSLPFRGSEKLNITLQTIHASKGLQYDHVLLSRISSQVSTASRMNSLLGASSPYVFRQLTFLKKSWKTPYFYKLQEKDKASSKEESLRLFYVACTRARKTLSMSLSSAVRLESWGRLVLDLAQELNLLEKKQIDEKAKSFMQNEVRLLPIFQSRIFKEWRKFFSSNQNQHQQVKLIPSLSVTSLLVFEKCPQKFYFQNILNLEPQFEVSPKKSSLSSAKRGTKVHGVLQNYLSKKIDFEEAKNLLDNNVAKFFELNAKKWLALVDQSTRVHIEKELRFSWKGNVILGTPDLYLVKDETLEVWDFKTGEIDEEDLRSYQQQLKWYAMAITQFEKNINYNTHIVLKILKLDMMEEAEWKTDLHSLESELSSWWSSFGKYHTKKLSHCSKCSYQVYCDKNSI
jgi:ATP-dependent helicase/nuclease subunit A